MLRWRIAILISAAIAISYLDRQTLPVAIGEIRKDFFISNQVKAFLDSAFLLTYGLMYVGGGRLMDILGTRRGFTIIMIFWSVACASHGFAGGVIALAASRLLLGVGEGGGFPAATRAVAEWFPVKERSTAMGIINAGTGLGGILAPPLIAWVITNVTWFGISPWRWVFFITGALGLIWTVWWAREYFPPGIHPRLQPAEREHLRAELEKTDKPSPTVPIAELLRFRETWGVIGAKFLSDAAWYFYMFWLPKYLLDERGFNIKEVGSVAWIPFAAAALGCLVGGGLSSWLLHRGFSVNAARKIALGLSAAMMPCVMLVPHVSVPWVIFLFSVAFFGQQSWSAGNDLADGSFPEARAGHHRGFRWTRWRVGRCGARATRGVFARSRFQLHARVDHRGLTARSRLRRYLPCHSVAPALSFTKSNMKTALSLLLNCALLMGALSARADHSFLCTDSAAGKVCVVSVDGKVEWECKCNHPQDCWRLPNGNYLFCHATGALEMTPDKKIAWEYKAGTNTEVHACQPLPDGRVLLVECGPSRLVEVDRDGKIAKELKLPPPPPSVGRHDQFRGVRKTKDGHYLICRKGEHEVQELDGDGKVLRQIKVPGDVHEVVQLPGGNLLITCGDGHKVIELDANDKVVWELNENDLPGHPLRLMAGCQRLPNGNTVFCNWLGHGHLGEQAQIFELTPDKKIVWEFADQTHFKAINQIQLLDVPGDVTKGEILR